MNAAPPPFRPAPLLRGATAQTIAGALLPPPRAASLPQAERLELEVEPGERLLLLRTPAVDRPRGRLMLFHGLGGHADSRYLRHTLKAAHRRGWEVMRVNARGSGEGAGLARRLPHAGRWRDFAAALDSDLWTPAAASVPLAAVGFSMGGGILLRCLGETGSRSPVAAAVAVNPPTDLSCCLRELERPRNRLFHRYYVRALMGGLARRARRHPETWRRPDPRLHCSVRAMDEDYVAPDAGYESAEAYYAACSARVAVAGVTVPTLVISAADDPFVPADMLRRDLAGNSRIRLTLLPAGGHMGYLEWRQGRLGFWAADAVLDVLEEQLGQGAAAVRPAPAARPTPPAGATR